jgi:hypothetical protein
VLGPLRFGVRLGVDQAERTHGRVHLVWLWAGADPGLGGFAGLDNPVMTAYSDDAGQTFSVAVRLSSPSRPRVVAPAMVVGAGGRLDVAYYDLGADIRDYMGLPGPVWDGTWSLVVRSSADGGRRFGPEEVVDDSVVAPERVMLIFTMPPPALARDRDGLCLAWADGRSGDSDVLFRCSGRSPASWTPAKRLNDDGIGNGRRQYLPRLAVAPDGRIDAVFYDRRSDPGDRMNDVTYTYSLDAGRTFSPNVRLTTEQTNTLIGPRYAVVSADGQTELGGRLGLLATDNGAVAAWADTRNGTQGRTGQDVFATRVCLYPSHRNLGSFTRWASVVGVTAVILAFRPRARRGRKAFSVAAAHS